MNTKTDAEEKIRTNHLQSFGQAMQKKTVLTSSQKQSETLHYFAGGIAYRIKVTIRYDDECNNGHNTFAITAQIDEKVKNNGKNDRWREYMGGCCHKEIAKYFPKLAPYIKWHLVSADEPLHYIANAIYHRGLSAWNTEANEDNLKSTIIYGAIASDYSINFISLSKEELTNVLKVRLPLLMTEFRKAMESLGFIY